MGTRSIIAYKLNKTEIKFVYSHWDGYPQHVGNLLYNHYNTDEKIEELLSMGFISSLAENIHIPNGVNHSFDKPDPSITVFYGRDRGDINSNFLTVKNETQLRKMKPKFDADFIYLFRSGRWFYQDCKSSEFSELTLNVIKGKGV